MTSPMSWSKCGFCNRKTLNCSLKLKGYVNSRTKRILEFAVEHTPWSATHWVLQDIQTSTPGMFQISLTNWIWEGSAKMTPQQANLKVITGKLKSGLRKK